MPADGNARQAKRIGQSKRQRLLGSDHDKVDFVRSSGVDDACDVSHRDGEIGGDFRRTRVARSAEEGIDDGTRSELPCKRMLTSAPAYHQNS
jgi:hypothetical protein